MKKWIEIEGKKMDAVEFTRFIRQRMAPETRRTMKDVLERERHNGLRLKRLQQLS